jgi:hypothetical protein
VTLPPQTLAFLAQPALGRVWTVVRRRLEGNGVQPQGSIRLADLDAAEREAVSLLMGRRIGIGSCTIRLAELDARLRATAAGCSLVAALEHLGPPLTDRRGDRDTGRQARAAVWTAAEQAVAGSPLADQD